MENISAVVLVKNEGLRIEDCLVSLTWVDEVIVVDNGSTDDTVLRAKKYGAGIIESHETSFAKLREIGLREAKGEWVLYVDADEEVTQSLAEEIRKTVASFDPRTSSRAYFIKRINYFLGRKWPYQDRMQRLFWKPSLQGWHGVLHETASVDGKQGELTHPLIHKTHRRLEEMVNKTNEWSVHEARLRFQTGHKPIVWWRLMRVMWTGFSDSFLKQGGWKAGTFGLIESVFQGFSMFVTYAKLWELQMDQKSKKD